jgi:glutamine transport system substrate-binding protein
VAVKTGTATVDFMKSQVPDAKLKLFPNIDNAYLELATGRVDAAVHDTPNVQYYANSAGKGKVKVVGNVKSGDFYGIAFPKGSDLVPQVNKALATLKANGQYDAIYAKWFGQKP